MENIHLFHTFKLDIFAKYKHTLNYADILNAQVSCGGSSLECKDVCKLLFVLHPPEQLLDASHPFFYKNKIKKKKLYAFYLFENVRR